MGHALFWYRIVYFCFVLDASKAFEFNRSNIKPNYLKNSEDVLSVYPKVSEAQIDGEKVIFVQLDIWLILFHEGHLQLAPDLKTEWIRDNTSTKENLLKCDYKLGTIQSLESVSRAAASICKKSLTGYFEIRETSYFFYPVNQTTGEHILYKSENVKSSQRRSPRSAPFINPDWLFNLTGDTIDILDNESDVDIEFDHHRHRTPDSDVSHDNGPKKNESEEPEIPMEYLRGSSEEYEEDEEINGYFLDTAWSALPVQTHKWSGNNLPTRWLEIAVAADHTLISFHGKDKIEEYVLALMNIVSAIYQDSSLEANTKVVIARLLFYEHENHGIIRPGNAKRSLENVNIWNRKLHSSLKPDQPKHDIAIWLTRSDIGGPSGYAPVAGVCDPKRSCALTKDEGLTSAFIIAHEMAHILGLSHDGDKKSGNNCDQDAYEGSVMAPMVAATFSRFSWSECSKREFQNLTRNWTCLSNPPKSKEEILLNSTLQTAFNMDEQCRMEFGDGYSMCRAFEITEPCQHLWCSHVDSPLVCKTKKGPPLEGTECGFGKWCAGGYCSDIPQEATRVPVVLNPQHGGWSDWGPWGLCSRTCGIGVQYRFRSCNNPKPSYGGQNCEGETEEYQLCNRTACSNPYIDLRAQQCKMLPKYFNMTEIGATDTWLPYESTEEEEKCKFSCVSEERKEILVSEENLPDGTPCSYDNEDNLCIQGRCHWVGCDGILNSSMSRDMCGVCGGDSSECTDTATNFKKVLKREVSRIAVIPKMARHIRVETNVSYQTTTEIPSLAFVLKNRKKKGYVVTIPNAAIRTKIVEGTNFFYRKAGNNHNIWGTGPILTEIIIMVVATKKQLEKGIRISYNTQYFIHKEFLIPSKRFVWILGGWGPCSAICGGGRRQKTVACWDNRYDKLVKRKHCSLMQKPAVKAEMCNTFGCNFVWFPGKWEPCSSTCGNSGIQYREVYCVPNSILNSVSNQSVVAQAPWKFMVNPNKCSGQKLTTSRPCNQNPCFYYWEFSEWSQCSTTCGTGMTSRTAYCPALGDGTCGEPPPTQRKVCMGNFTRHTNKLCSGRKLKSCKKDESVYCSFDMLQRYCVLKGFRSLCCKSCAEFDKQQPSHDSEYATQTVSQQNLI